MLGDIIKTVLQNNNVSESLIQTVIEVLRELSLLDAIKTFIPLHKGMTNQLFHFCTLEEEYMLRLPGAGTEHIINRQHEVAVYQALEESDITEEILYISAQNGIKVSKFMKQVHNCDKYNQLEISRCMELLRDFHNKNLKVSHVFDIFAEIRLYEEQCGVCIGSFGDCLNTRRQVMELRNLIKCISKENCLCHIDPVYDNFLMDDDTVRLIDWEYAAMCDPYIDIAMFCIYAEYNREQTDWVIGCYLGESPSTEQKLLVYAYMSACSYLWVLWSEIKRMEGIDYWEYEKGQYQIAKDFYQYAMDLYRRKNM